MTNFPEYERYDGLGLADLVRRREVSTSDLVEEALARIEARNPSLNAVITVMAEEARAAGASPVDGPFAGVPFLLKDLGAACAGVRQTHSSRFLKDYVATQDDEIVGRYRRAGLIVMGRTNTPELGLAPVTEPILHGPTANPWNPSRTPGGSSGGSAAAVAAAIVPLAHASDGGGSIRIPASCCGLFGLKPSRGRTPMGPAASEGWQGLATDHVVSRSVRDSAAALDATAGPAPGDPYAAPPPARPFLAEVGADPGRLRVAFSTAPFFAAEVDTECVLAVSDAANLCADLGHRIEEAAPVFDGEALAAAFVVLIAAEVAAEIASYGEITGRRPDHSGFEPETWVIALLGRQYTAMELAQARKTLLAAGRVMGAFLSIYDVLLTPTLALPPVTKGALKAPAGEAMIQRLIARFSLGPLIPLLASPDKVLARVFSFMPFTPLANATGQPAMSVPLYWSEAGLPIGVMFAARYGDEATLFRLAAQLEAARPWAERRPPLA